MTNAQPHRTGWVGWIYFAGIVMLVSGMLNILDGIMAIANPDWAIFSSDGQSAEMFLLDIKGWGWLHVILGIIIVLAGIGVFSGNVLARTVGVIMAVVSIVVNFAAMSAFPFWALVIIVVDMLVIWALTVHGREPTYPNN